MKDPERGVVAQNKNSVRSRALWPIMTGPFGGRALLVRSPAQAARVGLRREESAYSTEC